MIHQFKTMAFCFISWIGLLKPLQLQTFTIMIVVPRHKGTLWPFLLSSVSSSKAAVASALGALRCATILAKAVWGSSGFERSLPSLLKLYFFVRSKRSLLCCTRLSRLGSNTAEAAGKKERPRPRLLKKRLRKCGAPTHFPLWRYFWGGIWKPQSSYYHA